MTVLETIKDKAGVVKDKAGIVISSVTDINGIAIDKIEETSKLGLSTAGYFCDISIKQLRAASGVRDIESLRKFTADSISLSGEIAKKVLDDSKLWMSVGSDLKEKVVSVFKPKEEMASKKKVVTKSVAA